MSLSRCRFGCGSRPSSVRGRSCRPLRTRGHRCRQAPKFQRSLPGTPAAVVAWLTAVSSRCAKASVIGRSTSDEAGGALADGCGDVGSPAQPDAARSSIAVTTRAARPCTHCKQSIRKEPCRRTSFHVNSLMVTDWLALRGFVLRQVVPDDAHLTMRQAGRIAMELAVEFPRRATLVAVRVDFVAVGEP